ncbi:MAG: alpha/beta hydrolase [Acidobacteria bacterium]|nr:alpha/beta hydrolase [Acidobacteriota bacterium]
MTSFTLIAIHGNGGGGFRFERVRPYIPAHIRFLTPTLPGFAEVPPNKHYVTITDYAEHLYWLVKEQTQPVVVLGTGIGGSIILEFLQFFAFSVEGAILHAPVGADLDRRWFPQLMNLPGMRALGKRAFSSRLARPVWKRLLFEKPIPADYVDQFFEEYRRCSVFGQMFDLITPHWFQILTPVDIPSVLLWGEHEKGLNGNQLNALETLLPQAQVRIVPDWDQFPMIEQPEEYAAEIVVLAARLLEKNKGRTLSELPALQKPTGEPAIQQLL